ncbi:hypothetical protein EYF80_060278 [Liparis tanakae]|uniref:Uncharacterized protein n=1 Tax=Liparis tanakae TaxID=230148 RepID=A0A4Z2EL55_9TELE|nr:hypothetical protein EYF80_060278 [Liparis tanakae]
MFLSCHGGFRTLTRHRNPVRDSREAGGLHFEGTGCASQRLHSNSSQRKRKPIGFSSPAAPFHCLSDVLMAHVWCAGPSACPGGGGLEVGKKVPVCWHKFGM